MKLKNGKNSRLFLSVSGDWISFKAHEHGECVFNVVERRWAHTDRASVDLQHIAEKFVEQMPAEWAIAMEKLNK